MVPKWKKKRLHVIFWPPLGLLLEPQWEPKIFKNRLQRVVKCIVTKSLGKRLQKGTILWSSTCLKSVRDLQNRGSEVFR